MTPGSTIKDGFTDTTCSWCYLRFHKDEVISWRGEKPYHKGHAHHHEEKKGSDQLSPVELRASVVRV